MRQLSEQDPGSLARLHGLTPLEPISSWPPALGWWVLGVSLLILAVVFESWRRRRRRAEAYRGLARVELERTRAAGGGVVEVATILKATALSAYPREEVAQLHGAPWLAFLDRTGGSNDFSQGSGRALAQATYDPSAAASLPPSELDSLFRCAEAWISGHRREEGAS